MKLFKTKSPIPLYALPCGLFMSQNGTLCMKSEYRNDRGAIEAYIVSSGEMFWGGTDDPEKQRNLEVFQVNVIEEIADQPAFIKDEEHFRHALAEEMTRTELIDRVCEYNTQNKLLREELMEIKLND